MKVVGLISDLDTVYKEVGTGCTKLKDQYLGLSPNKILQDHLSGSLSDLKRSQNLRRVPFCTKLGMVRLLIFPFLNEALNFLVQFVR